MIFHLDYLLDLPGVKVETCNQIEGQIYLKLSVVASEIICPHCNNYYTEELHQNRPILARYLSVFGRFVYLQLPRRQFYCPSCQRYSTEKLEFLNPKRRHTRRYEQNIYARVQQSSMEQIGREEGLSYDEIKGMFAHVHCEKKKLLGVSQASEYR
jgi:transposase